MSEEMKDQIVRDLQKLYGDTSVPAESTAGHLQEIASEIDIMLDGLRADGVEV